MYQQPSGLLRLQSVLANRRYSYGGQLPSEMEQNAKIQNFGNVVGGGIEQMQRIFNNSNNSSDGSIRTTSVATTTSDGNGGSGIQKYLSINSSKTSSPTTITQESRSDGSIQQSAPQIPTYDNSSNLNVAKQQNYQDVNYKEMIPEILHLSQ